MSSFSRSILISIIAIGFSAPAFAQPKADAGAVRQKAPRQQTTQAAGRRRARNRTPTQRPAAILTDPLKTALGLRPAQSRRGVRSQ